MTLKKELERHADGSLWYDLDVLAKEEVEVLQPDKTWKHFSGPKFQVWNVSFDGKPEEVAAEMQKIRDGATWGDHAVIQAVYVYPLADGEVRYVARMWMTSTGREFIGPLPSVQLTILREIAGFLLRTMLASEDVIMSIMEKRVVASIKEEEDQRFFRWVDAMLEAAKRARLEVP